jgi:hypothetical protein
VNTVSNHPLQDVRLPEIGFERENRRDVIFQGCRLSAWIRVRGSLGAMTLITFSA